MGVLFILGATLIWSVVPFAVQGVFSALTPVGIGVFRFLFATVTLMAIRALRGSAPWPSLRGWRHDIGWFVLAGIGIGANNMLYALGLKYTNATVTTLLIQVEILGLVVLAWLLLGEHLGRRRILGMVAAFVGVSLVVWNGETLRDLLSSRRMWGNLALLAGGFMWSGYGLGQKALTRTRGTTESLVPIFTVATAFCCLTAFFQPMFLGPLHLREWMYIIFLGSFCTGVSYILLAHGMRKIDASAAGPMTCALPLFTGIEAHFLRHDPLTPALVSGAILILLGIAIVSSTTAQES
jgi:drug/metabolite transporter (DMT)-like permease